MRKLLITTLLSLIFFAGHSQTKNFIDQPYVEVNGNADTAITPDEIYIKITISESDTKNKISVEDQERQMVDALKALGIDTEKDLTTSDVASNFKYYFLKGKDVLKTKAYILKVSDAITVTKVIGQLEDLGISNTSIERVNYSGLENLRNVIKSKAIENAKTRALALTKPLNQTLGAAIYIGEMIIPENYNMRGAQLGEVVVVGDGTANKSRSELPKIEFEKIKVETSVNVKFILKE